MHLRSLSLWLTTVIPLGSSYSTWCGKYYEQGAPRTPPPMESRFLHHHTDTPLLDFRCVTASSLYLPDDDKKDPPAIIFDAAVGHAVGSPYHGHVGPNLTVTVFLNSQILLAGIQVPTGSKGMTVPVTLDVEPSFHPRTITCKAELPGQVYEDTTDLLYLPHNIFGGSTVKLDRRSGGGMMVRNESTRNPVWEKLIPFGFYDSFDSAEKAAATVNHPFGEQWYDTEDLLYHNRGLDNNGNAIRTNIDRLNLAKQLGFNFIHPVPPGVGYGNDGDNSAFEVYLDHAEKLGIWIMYDMRHSFSDLALVRPQIEAFRNRKNLLLWYTGDEPDGNENSLDSTERSRDLIHKLDPYHPVSLCLNCADYHWKSYASGSDIILADVYSIALNAAWSKRYNTPVTADYGCSGCDGCQGSMYDLTGRIDEWSKRRRAVGRERTLPIWVVPQAFDDAGDEFWWRSPTGDEEAVQVVLAFNHGVLGHCAWSASSASNDIFRNASMMARNLYAQTRFIYNAAHTRQSLGTSHPNDGSNGLDVASWTIFHQNGIKEVLVLAANFNYNGKITFSVPEVKGRIREVLFGDVRVIPDDDKMENGEGTLSFEMRGTSVAGVVVVVGKKVDEELEVGLRGGGFGVQLALGIAKGSGLPGP